MKTRNKVLFGVALVALASILGGASYAFTRVTKCWFCPVSDQGYDVFPLVASFTNLEDANDAGAAIILECENIFRKHGVEVTRRTEVIPGRQGSTGWTWGYYSNPRKTSERDAIDVIYSESYFRVVKKGYDIDIPVHEVEFKIQVVAAFDGETHSVHFGPAKLFVGPTYRDQNYYAATSNIVEMLGNWGK